MALGMYITHILAVQIMTLKTICWQHVLFCHMWNQMTTVLLIWERCAAHH